MQYKAYIDQEVFSGVFKIYVARFVNDDMREVLSYKDGATIITKIGEVGNEVPYLQIPRNVFDAIKEKILFDAEQQGGAPSQQYLRGKCEQLEKEVEWLRSQVELYPYNKPFTPISTT